MKAYLGRAVLFLAAGMSVFAQTACVETIYQRLQVCKQLQPYCSERQAHELVDEMACFPVQKDASGKEQYYFEDGYGGERTYGGKRRHEGIDIMTTNNCSGYFKVQSVCSGVVEKIGWLRLGGYRIGIRSDAGYYYYYAHLARYRTGIQKGTRVEAGEVLGYMGDTGYGKEGTSGKFAVHLHFGIYLPAGKEEKSINPYELLKYVQV